MLKMTRGEGWRLLKDSVPFRGFQTPSTLMVGAHPYQHLPPLLGMSWTAPSSLSLINLEDGYLVRSHQTSNLLRMCCIV